jgi:hypothetical protein
VDVQQEVGLMKYNEIIGEVMKRIDELHWRVEAKKITNVEIREIIDLRRLMRNIPEKHQEKVMDR